MNSCVIDVGGHDGSDTLFYLTQGYYVYTIEANPDLCKQIENSIPKGYRDMCEVHNIGINKPGISSLDFYVSNISQFSSFKKDFASKLPHWREDYTKDNIIKEVLKIKTTSLDEFIDDYVTKEIEYIKIDIDGSNLEAGLQLKKNISSIKYLSIEVGAWDDHEFLYSDYGFKKFYISDQTKVSGTKNVTDAYGKVFQYDFPHGASGPWGADIDNWLSPGSELTSSFSLCTWRDLHCSKL